MNNAVTDPRASFSTIAAVLITAIGLTVNWLAPDIPNEIMTAWGAVFMLLARFGEVWYDRKTIAMPRDATPAESKAILKDA